MRRRRLAPVGIALVSLWVCAGCVSYSGSTPAAKVRSWASTSSLVSDNAAVVSDVADARLAAQQKNASELRTICAGLAFDVGTAYDTLPAPDHVLTSDLNASDEVLLHAAGACSQVSSAGSTRARSALVQMAQGLADLRRAQERALTLGVSWPGKI